MSENEKRTVWGRFLRYVLGPIYYHLGLLDRHCNPSNAKLMYTAAFVVNLIFVMIFGGIQARSEAGLTSVWLFWAIGTMAFAAGHQVFKDFLDTRGGGLGDAVAKQAEAVAKAIAARRAAGAGEGVEVTS